MSSTEEQYVRGRTSFLTRKYDLRDEAAQTIAWCELGYSSSGIAKRVGVTDDTVAKYMETIEERFGVEALYAQVEEQRETSAPLEAV